MFGTLQQPNPAPNTLSVPGPYKVPYQRKLVKPVARTKQQFNVISYVAPARTATVIMLMPKLSY